MAKRKRRKFTPEFKAEAVRLCQVGDRSAGQVAKDLDLTETALREWVRRAEADQSSAPREALATAEREELLERRKRVRRLEVEREILKKSGGLLREGDDVKFAFVDAEKACLRLRGCSPAMASASPRGRSRWVIWRSSATANPYSVPSVHRRRIIERDLAPEGA